MKKYFLLLLISFLFIGCLPEPTTFGGKYSPKVAAEKNLSWAKDAIKREYYDEAYRYLSFVKAKYPYELEVIEKVNLMYGDIYFSQGLYNQAIDVYRVFIKRYPTSKFVSYAQFKVAESYFKEIPSDFFLLPPPYERDKESIIYARKALAYFLSVYPKDIRAPKAHKMYRKATDYIANYDFYVGNFYYDKKKYQGAIWRYENMMQKYPKSSYYDAALCNTVKSYYKLGNSTKNPEKTKELLNKFNQYKKMLRKSCEL